MLAQSEGPMTIALSAHIHGRAGHCSHNDLCFIDMHSRVWPCTWCKTVSHRDRLSIERCLGRCSHTSVRRSIEKVISSRKRRTIEQCARLNVMRHFTRCFLLGWKMRSSYPSFRASLCDGWNGHHIFCGSFIADPFVDFGQIDLQACNGLTELAVCLRLVIWCLHSPKQ